MCRNRIDSEEKLQTVRLILNGKESLRHAAERLGIRFPSIQQWISIYQSEGEDAFSRSGYRRIVSFVISNSNNNALVFDTFDVAIAGNPGATPLCHSDYAEFRIIVTEVSSIQANLSAHV